MPKKTFSQSNYFTSYDSRSSYSKNQKKTLTNQAIDLKNRLANGDHDVTTSLNKIALGIQSKINTGELDSESINEYKKMLRDAGINEEENINKYIKICIILSKHTGNDSKINWFGVTNKTDSIDSLIRGVKYHNVSNLDISSSILPANLFNFEYTHSRNDLLSSKFEKEDRIAYASLQSPELQRVVRKVTTQLAKYIESNLSENEQHKLFANFRQLNANMSGYCPTLDLDKLKINSMEDLINILERSMDHAQLVSITWMLANGCSGGNVKGIDNIWQNILKSHKDYTTSQIPIEFMETSRTKIGISDSPIQDDGVFKKDVFIPWCRTVDYRSVSLLAPKGSFAHLCNKEEIPSVSGLSEVANMYCRVMDALNISPYSEDGAKFMEAACGFIVASGMNSYFEAIRVFNEYIKAFHQNENLPMFDAECDQQKSGVKVDLQL